MRQELDRLQSVFRVRAGLLFLDDRDAPDAYATNQPYFASTHGTLVFGRNLLWGMLRDERQGGAALMGVLAHEMGHILQFAIGLQMDHTAMERHADFMAGYYMGIQQPRRQFQLRDFASSLYGFGDYNGSHGTPRERVGVMLAGYQHRDRDLRTAIQAGIRFARGGYREVSSR
ncbi:MAG: hypothetical protein IT169_11985 [Bryobacterales bacterium]|nr:hypothetical protein [Bryobacterales bacterium]